MTVSGLVMLALLGLGALAVFGVLGRGRRPLDLRDPADQLIAVRRAAFAAKPVMNRSEFKRFRWIEGWARGTPYRLFTQVSYGEIIRSEDRDAQASINAKRADFVLADADGLPALVIEYQGSGHGQGNAAARDKVKRAALGKAGVPLLEIYPDETREAVLEAVAELVRHRTARA